MSKQPTTACAVGGRPTSDAGPVLKFRNYQPHSEKLQEEVTTVAKPVVPAVEEQVHARPLCERASPEF